MGEGVAESGRISPASRKRGEAVLREYDAILREEGVRDVRAVATGIFRVAENAGEVLRNLSQRLSHPIRLISGAEEGRHTLSGIRAGLDLPARSACLVFDIGGGSTELVRQEGNGKIRIESLPIGALCLKERFGTEGKGFDFLRKTIGEVLDDAAPFFVPAPRWTAIGTGGSVTTMAFMLRRNRRYDPERIHRTVLTARDVTALLQTILPLTSEVIQRRYFLEPGKADLVLFGGALLLEILLRIPGQRVTVSDYGLLEGVAMEE